VVTAPPRCIDDSSVISATRNSDTNSLRPIIVALFAGAERSTIMKIVSDQHVPCCKPSNTFAKITYDMKHSRYRTKKHKMNQYFALE